MSLEDPFFVVREEVIKSVNTCRGLYSRWSELSDSQGGGQGGQGGQGDGGTVGTSSREELDWTCNELKNSLRSIDWDLEDLEETISIVEKNPKKFRITDGELSERKGFIEKTRQTVKDMREELANPSGGSKQKTVGGQPSSRATNVITKQSKVSRPRMDRYTRLHNDYDEGGSSGAPPTTNRFLEDTQRQQQMEVRTQDDQLELISGSVGVLKHMSGTIGNELDEQAVMLDDFAHEMDQTETRLDNVMLKVTKVLGMTTDKRQWCAIGILSAILLLILMLFFIL